jgi:hypothetical protein
MSAAASRTRCRIPFEKARIALYRLSWSCSSLQEFRDAQLEAAAGMPRKRPTSVRYSPAVRCV